MKTDFDAKIWEGLTSLAEKHVPGACKVLSTIQKFPEGGASDKGKKF